ncbi:ESPR-type extended signal peptide-containing protein [Acinetobacter larvae]|uniref:Uncharacterized protein n=1 Tax=Acinetobacter larvae TaxID=1789224 RepID=A0A1B2M0T3_9GAMM|nr:ESPR-type extended signal peptide-containing protein [Acinetobacter larvae]AOA58800.1 hypothetical protein BFG52_10870 [Acinetobacter larvae]
MNKIYRVVWNAMTGCWAVAAETAKTKSKSNSRSLTVTACSLMGAILISTDAMANLSLDGGKAEGTGTIAIGRSAVAGSTQKNANESIAIGVDAIADGDQSIALGANTRASGRSAVAIGGDDVDKLAQDATLSKKYTSITGGKLQSGNYQNTTAKEGSTAVGVQAFATGDFSSAYGLTSKATGDVASAFGVMATATAKGATAVGSVSTASADGATAIGMNSTASGKNAVAIGAGNAAGQGAQALADRAVSIGFQSKASLASTIAIGADSLVSVAGGTALGTESRVNGQNGLALGTAAQVTQNNAVALGASANTVTNATAENQADVAGISYQGFAGQAKDSGMQVSVGRQGQERQIKNLAAGAVHANSTDAINGSQLYATQKVLGNLATSNIQYLGGNSKLNQDGTISYSNIGGTGKNTVDAAIATLNTSSKAAKTQVVAGDNIVVTEELGNDGQSIYQVKTAKDVSFDQIKLGETSIDASGIRIDQGPSVSVAGIDAANKKINNVAAAELAADSKDAVNGSQLFETNQNLNRVTNTANDALKEAAKHTTVVAGDNVEISEAVNAAGGKEYTVKTAKDVSFDQIKLGETSIDASGIRIDQGPSVTVAGIDAANKKINNVAAAELAADSKDAVNGSQLFETNQNLNRVTNTANDALKEAAKHTTVVAGDNVEVSEAVNAAGGKEYTVKTAKDVSFDQIKLGETSIDASGIRIDQGPSVTVAGIDAANKKINNVAAAELAADSKDAVNGSQLFETNQNLNRVTNTANDALKEAAKHTTVVAGDNVEVSEAVNAAGGKEYTVKTAKDVSFDRVHVGAVQIDKDSQSITGLANTTLTGDDFASKGRAATEEQLKLVRDAAQQTDGFAVKYQPNKDGSVNYDQVVLAGKTIEASPEAGSNRIQTTGGTQISNLASAGDYRKVENAGNAVNAADLNNAVLDTSKTLSQKGLNFVGNDGQTIHKNLSETLQIVGGLAQDKAASAENIKTVNQDGTLAIQLATNLTGLESLSVEDGKGNKTYTTASSTKIKDVLGNTTSMLASGTVVENIAGDRSTVTAGVVNIKDAKGTTIINGSGVNLVDGPRFTREAIDVAGHKINNVAAGTADSDAVNVKQLQEVKNTAEKGWLLSTNQGAANPVKPGDRVDFQGDENIRVSNQGNDVKVTLNKDLAVDRIRLEDEEGHQTILDKTGSKVKNAAGDESFYGAQGIVIKDKDGQQSILNQDGLSFVRVDGTLGPSISVNGINAGYSKIINVQNGVIAKDSQDAVNGGQIHDIATSISNVIGGNSHVNTDGSMSANNIGNTGKNNIHEAIDSIRKDAASANQGWDIATDNGKTSTVKPGNTLNINGDADKNITVSNNGNNVTVELAKDIQVDSVKAGNSTLNDQGLTIGEDVSINKDGLNIAGGPSINKSGIDAGDKVVRGVGSGLVDSNGKATDLANANGNNAVNIDDLRNSVNSAAAAAKTEVKSADNNLSVNNIGPGKNGQSIYEIALAKDLNVNSVTLGDTHLSQDGLKIGQDGPSISKSGIDAGQQKVTGVADATIAQGSQDAVNGGQLHAQAEGVKNIIGGNTSYDAKTGTYTNNNIGGTGQNNIHDAIGTLNGTVNNIGDQITNLGDRMEQVFYDTNKHIDKVEKKANAGIAAAMAMESAPFVAGKYTYAAGAAYHGGENAIGITLRKTSDNGRWSITGGVAAASQGDPSVRIGISGVID